MTPSIRYKTFVSSDDGICSPLKNHIYPELLNMDTTQKRNEKAATGNPLETRTKNLNKPDDIFQYQYCSQLPGSIYLMCANVASINTSLKDRSPMNQIQNSLSFKTVVWDHPLQPVPWQQKKNIRTNMNRKHPSILNKCLKWKEQHPCSHCLYIL